MAQIINEYYNLWEKTHYSLCNIKVELSHFYLYLFMEASTL